MAFPKLSAAVLGIAVVLGLGQISQGAWIAGRDLVANERPNGAQELINPNFTVPEWSYGWRADPNDGATFNPFTPLDHFNDGGAYPEFDGWSAPTLGVNAGIAPIVFNYGFGPLDPVAPQELILHPAAGGVAPIVRWTAPSAGQYDISAYWQVVDPYAGDGGVGYVFINGTQEFSGVTTIGLTASASLSPFLAAGDTVDFLYGMRDVYANETTRADFTIAAVAVVPEPPSIVLLAVLLGAGTPWRKRRQ